METAQLPTGIQWLTEDEMKRIILNACGKRPHEQKDLFSLIKWAEGVRADECLLGMVLDGRLQVEWGGEEPRFSKGEDSQKK